ncbi:short-chain dehydrogenase [Nocardia otitidiscaviarum]|uniref:phthiocerol/phthiodiolone dimycocerosyl transferase family protein n=1 Tax=Nocardia otitidiscaviarum TaxID=1823 RepID=UPI0018949DBC|nr:short-chain dehydrogenase [Nocardia otitidiscaviarum]MBF6137595.1 short-chain dehydrogenase [Nocardia otitidiscaviarum]
MIVAGSAVVRPLSPSERWFWLIDRISPSNCIGRIRVHGRIAPDRLERAAAALVAEYPLLRVGVEHGAAFAPRFVPLADPRLPVRRVETDDPELWRAAVDAELAAPFDTATGLARAVDIVHAVGTPAEHHDILLTVSHVLLDGRSLITLLRKLIDYAAADGGAGAAATPVSAFESAADGRSPAAAPEPDVARRGRPSVTPATGSAVTRYPAAARPPFPPADDLIPRAARGMWRYLFTTLADQAVALVRRPRLLAGAGPVPLPDRRTRTVRRVLEARRLAALTAECRAAGVTVHGALVGAVAHAIGHTMRPQRSGCTGIASPVDFRQQLTPVPSADELGIYAPVLTTFVPFGPRRSLWSAARSVNRQLDRKVRQRRHLATVAGMRYGTPKSLESGWRVVKLIDRRAPWNVSVTNLGRVDLPPAPGEWRTCGLSVAAGNSCVSALTVAVATAHDEMSLEFCYVDGVLSPESAERFADLVLTTLADRVG